ncbi:hypothetical protein BsWGS_19286 [Bradybaena similaris]
MDNSDEEIKKSTGSFKIKRQTSRKGSTKHKKKDTQVDKEPEGGRNTDIPIEMLTPKHNGNVDGEDGDSDEEKSKNTASIKGMWKKALKTLKSNDNKQNRLAKKASFTKKKESEEEEVEPQELRKDIDPVYSLLKCAADLPKVPKAGKDGPCAGFLGSKSESLDSTSKSSSPSSSGGAGAAAAAQQHLTYPNQHGLESGSSVGGRDSRAASPTISNRDHMHHIVDESLGSEFRTFYKLTSPVKKHWSQVTSKKHSPSSSFDHN